MRETAIPVIHITIV